MLLNKTHGCESKSSTVGKPPLQASGDKMDSRTDPIAQEEKSLNKSVNHNFFLKLVSNILCSFDPDIVTTH